MVDTEPIDRNALRRGVSIFSPLSDDELDALLEVAVTKKLPRGRVLFRAGETGTEAYAITRGRLKATAVGGEGREFVFNIMGPGEVFGELAMIDTCPRSLTIEAIETSELVVLQRRDVLPFLERHPVVAVKMLQALAARVRHSSSQAQDALFLDVKGRLAKKLLSLASESGSTVEDGVSFRLGISQRQMGELVGATRESVNKHLRSWVDSGVITVNNRTSRITIHRTAELHSLSGSSLI